MNSFQPEENTARVSHSRPFWAFVVVAIGIGLWWDFGFGPQLNFADDAGQASRRTTGIRRNVPDRNRYAQPTSVGKNQIAIRKVFSAVTSDANQATVRFFTDDTLACLGTIVTSDGWILAKDSQCNLEMNGRLTNGRDLHAKKVAIDDQTDLCLLKTEATGLPYVDLATRQPPAVGSLVCSVNGQDLPMAVGVVSSTVRKVPREPGLLGIFISATNKGVRIDYIIPGSAAEKAGLQLKDYVTAIDGAMLRTNVQLQHTVRQSRPGDTITLSVLRNDEPLDFSATLTRGSDLIPNEHTLQNSMGGELSNRRSGFRQVIPHDTILQPQDCGGPLVNLDGQVVGINIARAGRVISYALPVSLVAERLQQLRANPSKFEPTSPVSTRRRP